MPLDPNLQKALDEASLAVEQQRVLVTSESKNQGSVIGGLFRVFSDHSAAQRRVQRTQDSRLLGGNKPASAVTPLAPVISTPTGPNKLIDGLHTLMTESGPALREALKAKLQSAEKAERELKDDALEVAEETRRKANVDLWQKLLILLAVLSPLQVVKAPKAARAAGELDWEKFAEEAEEAKEGGDQQESKTRELAADEDDGWGDREEKPQLFYISEGYAFQVGSPRWAFDYFCGKEGLWLSERDREKADELLGISDGFAFSSAAEREAYEDKVTFEFKFTDQADYDEYLSLTATGFKFDTPEAWETCSRTARPVFNFETTGEQRIYEGTLRRGFRFADQQDYNDYVLLVARQYTFKNQGEWEAYKAAIAAHETFTDKGYWESYKNRFRAQRQAPVAVVTDSLMYGPGLSSPPPEPAHRFARPPAQTAAFGRWLAWFLVLSCLAVCLGGFVCGVVALATQAAFWILPLDAALTVTVLSAVLLLIVLLGILAFVNSKASAPEPRQMPQGPLLGGGRAAQNRDLDAALLAQGMEASRREHSAQGPRVGTRPPSRPNTAGYSQLAGGSEAKRGAGQIREEDDPLLALGIAQSLEGHSGTPNSSASGGSLSGANK